ncbi:septum site-determining protein MinD [Methanococcoides vulcani]|uniref:Septum site-determining protein MinD n=1 Tax=Methanococcoides vulcani TaxID=1353158 RepID=A0A1H9Z581_9EURY|nr:AAA family ATPase [Methanococcoides vulcani]SES76646.1 septum site-determining protein MinD [Methanococcoides vulcani]
MGISIAVHSSKGGSGKTSFSINLAFAYTSAGKSVCLLDADFKAPSLFNYMFPDSDRWLNDVLDGKCDIMDAIVEVADDTVAPGKLYVGYCNPDIDAVREMSGKDRKWQSKALQNIMGVKKKLFSSGIDVLIIDTGPGVDFTSVNAIAAADYVIMVTKPARSHQKYMEQIIDGIYIPLGKDYGVIMNKCHDNKPIAIPGLVDPDIPVVASIPCLCDIATRSDSEVLTVADPEHPFSKAVFTVVRTIEDCLSNK